MTTDNIKSHLAQYERLVTLHPDMTEDERVALHNWERENLGDGNKATSDWPGWAEVIARLSH